MKLVYKLNVVGEMGMKTNGLRFVVPALILIISGCTGTGMGMAKQYSSNHSSAGSGFIYNPYAAGNGILIAGKGSSTVPTADAVVTRIKIGLENNVSPQAGNFQRSLAQVKNNLPKDPDPMKASGYDQVQLLVYAACSDLTTGNTPLMQSRYSVTKNGSIATNSANLIAAGRRMLDNYVAGLASQGPTSADVTAALTTLVNTIAGQAGGNSTIAFMSVCMAANTAGATLMSF
jgi:hypothetical protein